MKLLRYGPVGREKPAIFDDDAGVVRDLSAVIQDLESDVLLDSGLDEIRRVDSKSLPIIEVPERYGPCVGQVGKFVCVGLNYRDHAREAGLKPPEEPVLFMKATSSISGPNDPILLPQDSRKTDWEIELAAVIGKGGKYIDKSSALEHIAGYCMVNDVSEREFQIERKGQWVKGKSCDSFGPIGPWLVTRDEIPDPQSLEMQLKVNQEIKQQGTTASMIFNIAYLVSYISRFMSLQSGDIISTGTPSGVALGMQDPEYLKPGDVIEMNISGLGFQRHEVVQDKPSIV
ncbi:MAG: fumarylacetoacetate hydrolase family protein [Gammaproteobacteria bacterium]|nr:fumarylacetoacetate hydrolase family protein [Gammaproteobacteria bacterium]MCY4217976.1 fumarylacetoacetate hydrolase family protein [Gammaproteobacteria bacterium]MCY4274092.1 fumarylacetoacetate hydrolase family protein [Gammaproteobacteria bacterium]